MGSVCVRCGVVRRLLALKILLAGVWGFEGVSRIIILSRFARRGDVGIDLCGCCMGRFGLLGVNGCRGFSFGGCSD